MPWSVGGGTTPLLFQTRKLGHGLSNLPDATQLVSGGLDLDTGGLRPESALNHRTV